MSATKRLFSLALCSEFGTGFDSDFSFSDRKERRLGTSAAVVDTEDGLASEEDEEEEEMLAFSSAAVDRLDAETPLPREDFLLRSGDFSL